MSHDDGSPVLAEVTDGIGTITLNRPARRNAMSDEMLDELARHVTFLVDSDEVRAIVLTGAGRAFCSGGDVQDFHAQGGEGAGAAVVDQSQVAWQRRIQRDTVGLLHGSPKPVVAALPGAVAGAGLGLALAADFRIGCPRTVVATAFVGVALSGDFGVAWLLHHLVGPAKARELMMLNPRLDAEACLRLGLVHRVVEEAELAREARELAMRLATGPRDALAAMKDNLVHAPHRTLAEAMDAEVPLHKGTGLTEEHLAAIRAFVERSTVRA
jgi:2-(1,2-epoxy-1,2-dihydrophenyl)acetyl-CoA isomerase